MISLVVTTQGARSECVVRFVHSLDESKFRDFEVVFLDQSDGMDVKEIVHRSKSCNQINYLKIDMRPLSCARNLGLKLIRGNIVGFPDDDCWYSPDLLGDINEHFDNNRNIDVLCCNVFDPNLGIFYGRRRAGLVGIIEITQLNAFKYPISVGIFIKTPKEYRISFDEKLGVGSMWGSGEETDLILRMLGEGYKIKFASQIFVYHPLATEQKRNFSKFYNYGLGFGATIKKAVVRRQKLVLVELFEMVARSLGGVFCYVFLDFGRCKSYFYRFLGIVKGFLGFT